jgi:hypothetical protein
VSWDEDLSLWLLLYSLLPLLLLSPSFLNNLKLWAARTKDIDGLCREVAYIGNKIKQSTLKRYRYLFIFVEDIMMV